MKDKLSEIITRAMLRKLAGDRSYQRGEEYFQEDRVHHLAYDDTMVAGEVAGTQFYHTRLNVKNGELSGHCNCPVWQGGDFCKHQVALGLAYLARDRKPQSQSKSTFSWNEFLNKCRREELVKIILEMTPNNPQVVEKYRMENLPSSNAIKLRELKNVADSLFELAEKYSDYDDCYGYDEYNGRYDDNDDFFRKEKLFLKALDRIEESEDYELLWDISTYAIGKFLVSSATEDEDVCELIEKLFSYFQTAAQAHVKSDRELIEIYSEWEKHGDNIGYGFLEDTFATFPDSVRNGWIENALAQWKAFPKFVLGTQNTHDAYRSYVERELLAWANENGNDKLKLEILEKRLVRASDVQELLKEYQRQNLPEKVLPLLQKSWKAFPNSNELADSLVKEYLRLGEKSQALDFVWSQFQKEPMWEPSLNRLEKTARKLDCWPEYYQRVLAFLEKEDNAKGKGKTTSYWGYYDNTRQRRVEVLFNHGDKNAAWTLAQGANLSEEWWLKLAEWRSRENPVEAASVLKKMIDIALRPTGPDAYQTVVKFLKIYEKYMRLAKQDEVFTAFCRNIRTEYKRRRLLLEQMDKAKL